MGAEQAARPRCLAPRSARGALSSVALFSAGEGQVNREQQVGVIFNKRKSYQGSDGTLVRDSLRSSRSRTRPSASLRFGTGAQTVNAKIYRALKTGPSHAGLEQLRFIIGRNAIHPPPFMEPKTPPSADDSGPALDSGAG